MPSSVGDGLFFRSTSIYYIVGIFILANSIFQVMSVEDPTVPNEKKDEDFVKFLTFIKEFDRQYINMEEFRVRYDIFRASLKKIEELKKDPVRGKADFKVTLFADMTDNEKKRNSGPKSPK